jgi:hypothetical protein
MDKGFRHGKSVPWQRSLDALAEAARRAREISRPAGETPNEAVEVPAAAPAPPAAPRGPTSIEPAWDLTAELPLLPRDGHTERLVFDDNGPLESQAARAVRQPSTTGHGAQSPLGGRPTRRRSVRRAAPLAVLAATLVAVALLALNFATGSGGPRRSAVNSSRPDTSLTLTTSATTTTPPTTRAPTTTTTTPATTTTLPTTTTTTTTTPATSTTTPAGSKIPTSQLWQISPSEGKAGTVLDIRGSNFYSPGGSILARFDGQPAPTACPSQTSCHVTVPTMSRPQSSVTVTITTRSGTSNALTFMYK